MGHCNVRDVVNLEKVVVGMKIEGKRDVDNVCEFNRKPDERATKPMEFIHADLCGPLTPTAREGFRYVLGLIDDYSNASFAYFLKTKDAAANGLEKFLADTAPYGVVKRMRIDNGGEFIGQDFVQVMVKNKIKQEPTCPHSPHQNGTVERGWRTMFDMARCLLIESKLPKFLWTYAVMTSVYIRNRCFVQRTKQTPFGMLTGKKPNLKHMHTFGTVCYAYKTEKKKLDDRCVKGVFVGYDRSSPAYLVYYPDSKKIMKHRCVKFSEKFTHEMEAKPEQVVVVDHDDDDDFPGRIHSTPEETVVVEAPVNPQPVIPVIELLEISNDNPVPDQEGVENPVVVAVPEGAAAPATPPAPAPAVQLRRGERLRIPPPHLDEYVVGDQAYKVDFCYKVSAISKIPQSYSEAMASPESGHWKAAMDDEMKSLNANKTFTVTELPPAKPLVGGRWVFATKAGPGESIRYKARYVAKGFTQRYGSDYDETFAPTCKITTVRLMMQLAAEYNLILHQMDVKTAYLNAPIDKEIYMSQPEGYVVENPNNGTLVCRLNKSIYGLKQSGRNWNILLHQFFTTNNLIQSANDPCVYSYRVASDIAFILIWVDDIVIAAISMKCMNKIKNMLKDRFCMSDLGPLSWFLGIEFQQMEGVITMCQSKYLLGKLEKYGMDKAKPRTTPCELSGYDKMQSDTAESEFNYRELVGSLIYAMTCTRPDLAWAVTKLSQHLAEPSKADFTMVKHVFRYILGTVDYKLHFRRSVNGLKLIGYTDADWASSVPDRKSTSGYFFTLNETGPVLSWKSKKQPTVALSSCESEYVALCASVQESVYLGRLLHELLQKSFEPVIIHVDNQGAIDLAKNPTHHDRSKHIDIKYHFSRECVSKGKVEVVHVPSESNVADMMTKAVSKGKLLKFRDTLFGVV